MIFVDGQHEEMKIFMKVNSFLNGNMVPQNLFRACVQQVFYLSSCYAHTTPLFVFNKGWNVIFMRSMRFCELTFSNNNTSNNCQATSLCSPSCFRIPLKFIWWLTTLMMSTRLAWFSAPFFLDWHSSWWGKEGRSQLKLLPYSMGP